jgi:ABC-2 type transport system permease protein
MNQTVFHLTVREYVGQRRSLLILLLAAVPVGLALIVRFSNPDDMNRLDWIANTLMDGTLMRTILPLTCLLLGTGAFGSEFEGGTILYLLTKPITRAEIVLAKFAAAASFSMVFLVPATAAAGLIAIDRSGDIDAVFGFSIAVAAGILAYSALFVLLSLVTSRSLLIGLAYILVWEAIVTQLFSATAYLSIRQYCLGIADLFWNVDERTFNAEVAPAVAPFLALAITIGAVALSIRSLERLQIREPD